MNGDFVTYEIALKLKAKGFKEKCIAYYWEKINEHTPSFLAEDNMPEDGLNILDLLSNHNKAEWSPFIDAPTISQVLKWLRNKKDIYCLPYFEQGIDMWLYAICKPAYGCEFPEFISESDYDTYEQAAVAGIEYVLDKLI